MAPSDETQAGSTTASNFATVVGAALSIGQSLIPAVPAVIGLFELAATLVTEDRDPTPAELQQLSESVDQAHADAQAALQAAATAQTDPTAAQATQASVLAAAVTALAASAGAGGT